jgi:hypothetical protein
MSETIAIGRFRAQYHLRPSQWEARRRLDGLLPEVSGEAMELAVERAGMRSTEIVCIRSVHISVRLRLSREDSALAADWARVLAQAIQSAAADARTSVRFGSLPLALIDMGNCIAEGRFDRVWAWRQLGFWHAPADAANLSEASFEFGRALARNGESAVAVLAALASRGVLRRLSPYLEESWVEIAAAVLRAAGAPADVSESRAAVRRRGVWVPRGLPPGIERNAGGGEQDLPAIPALALERISRTLGRSRILAECHGTALPEAASLAVALLALLETEPALAQASPGQLIEAARALQVRAIDLHDTPAAAGVTPGSGIRSEHGPAERPAPLRAEGLTHFGGLLFLLRLVDELAIPERVLASPVLCARGLPWLQHRLALTLQPLAPDDPAALAFCGLPPGAPPPSMHEPLPSPEERESIEAFATEIRGALVEILPEPARAPEKLMQFVCRRAARIVADPGWIEARFSLLDVSTEIRRIGLDLDPNYVPWLGIVVRFVYE